MLPFLKRNMGGTGVMVSKTRTPDEKPPGEKPEGMSAERDAGQRLIDAVHAKDLEATVQAAHDLFQAFDAAPHVEGEHVED